MIIDAVTETGSRYRIDFDTMLWQKISRNGIPVATEKLWDLQVGTELVWPWDAPESWVKAHTPEIGKHLFVSGKDRWYASTIIVDIVEIESWTD